MFSSNSKFIVFLIESIENVSKANIYDKCSDISMYDFFMISIYKFISTLVGPMLNEPRILYMIF